MPELPREVPMPLLLDTVMAIRPTTPKEVLLEFETPQDAQLFRQWMKRGGGYQQFGDYVDSQ
jgi:hypothetical protein